MCRGLLVIAVWAGLAGTAHAAPIVRAEADVRLQGPAIDRSFLGFSQDFNIVWSEVGFPNEGVNPVLVQLYRNLAVHGAGAPVLRVGGNFQDSAWWNPTLRPRPPYYHWDVTPPYLESIARFLEAADANAVIGLNMAINRPSNPVAVARATQRYLPRERILAFEMGNEPHVYPFRPLGTDKDGERIPTRKRSYDFADFLPEFERHLRILNRRVRPRPRLAGPSLCCEPWLSGMRRLLRRNERRMSLVALHRYPLESCGHKPGERDYPNAASLLAQDLLVGNVRELLPTVRLSLSHGLNVRITEINSVACGGAEELSDRFAATLWAVDWMFNLAAIGVSGVNFHASSPLYQPFQTRFHDGSYNAVVKPLYYAMLLFGEAAANRPRLLPTTYYGQRTRGGANVKVWGTVDRTTKRVHVVLVNKDLRSGPARIRVPFATGPGRLKRLNAPSALANVGVTWAGQGFALPSYDGKLVGRRIVKRVPRRARSWFRFRLPGASAALLTVPVSRTTPQRTLAP